MARDSFIILYIIIVFNKRIKKILPTVEKNYIKTVTS